jgi:hypothetical protein
MLQIGLSQCLGVHHDLLHQPECKHSPTLHQDTINLGQNEVRLFERQLKVIESLIIWLL